MDAVDAKCDELGVMDAICYAVCEGQKLELALNAANDRIKQLEEAGDAVEERLGCGCGCGGPCRACQRASENWSKAKEAKP
jgi:hypothetical protein